VEDLAIIAILLDEDEAAKKRKRTWVTICGRKETLKEDLQNFIMS